MRGCDIKQDATSHVKRMVKVIFFILVLIYSFNFGQIVIRLQKYNAFFKKARKIK